MISSTDKVVENASYVSKLLIRPDIVDVFFISCTSGFAEKLASKLNWNADWQSKVLTSSNTYPILACLYENTVSWCCHLMSVSVSVLALAWAWAPHFTFLRQIFLTLLHSRRPKLYAILAFSECNRVNVVRQAILYEDKS